jgi:hypothetical protein
MPKGYESDDCALEIVPVTGNDVILKVLAGA